MELLQAIALLCQINMINCAPGCTTQKLQLECQQSYLHCVKVKSNMTEKEALERCVLEKK